MRFLIEESSSKNSHIREILNLKLYLNNVKSFITKTNYLFDCKLRDYDNVIIGAELNDST